MTQIGLKMRIIYISQLNILKILILAIKYKSLFKMFIYKFKSIINYEIKKLLTRIEDLVFDFSDKIINQYCFYLEKS